MNNKFNIDPSNIDPAMLAITNDVMSGAMVPEHTNHRNTKLVATGLSLALTAGLVVHDGSENSAFAADVKAPVTSELTGNEAVASHFDAPAIESAEKLNKEYFITADHAEHIENARRDADADKEYMPAGVIGEKPCGPKVDQDEVFKRMAAGDVVVKPSETAEFLNENPQVEAGLNNFYEELGDTEWIDLIIEELEPTNPDALEGGKDEGIRGLKAREEARQLSSDIDVQNHNCELETGEIFKNNGPNGSYNHLQKGDQVWSLVLPKDVLKKMQDQKIELPKELLTVNLAGGAIEIIMERLVCNNPLLEIEEEEPPVTTVETTVPETTVPETTVPETTETPTTSTTSTTTPASTTSTTTPASTTSTTSTTTPASTTSTTTPASTTSSTTTSTTMPHQTTTTQPNTTTTQPNTTTTHPNTTTTQPNTTTTQPNTTTTHPNTTTSTIRPEVAVSVESSVVAGPEATDDAPDNDNDEDSNVTTSNDIVTTTTTPRNPNTSTTTSTTTTTILVPNVTSTTLGPVLVD